MVRSTASLGITVLVLSVLAAQQQGQMHYFTPIPNANQQVLGQAAANDGALGLQTKKSTDGFIVSAITQGGPAEKAAIRTGDVVIKVNGKAATDLTEMGFLNELRKKPGEKVDFILLRASQQVSVQLVAEPRSVVYPQESKMPPVVGQYLFNGHAGVKVALGQNNPQWISLSLLLTNVDLPSITVDDAKFFVLDGSGQQLRRVSLDEIKYSIQAGVAQNVRTGSISSPPPPQQQQYTITGSANGNYTINDLGGGVATMTGTTSSTYTVTQQPDYGQLGYSLGLAIRQWRDRKHDQQLIQQGQQTLNQWDAAYFKATTPLILGENRTGSIVYWSQHVVNGPFRAVLFLSDPITNKEQPVVFEFR